MLLGKQKVTRVDNGRAHIFQVRIQPPKPKRHRLPLPLLNAHAIETPQNLFRVQIPCLLYRYGLCNAGAADGLHNLRRQAEAHVFRHYFNFFDVVEAI